MVRASHYRPSAAVAGVAAQLAGVIWVLQWAHALVAHGPTGFNQAQVWLGMTWMDSGKILALSYLLLTPGVLYLARLLHEAGDALAAGLAGSAVVILAVCAITTPLEFLTDGWGSYGTYVGASEPAVDVAGPLRSLASSAVLTVALAAVAARAARRRLMPSWMAPVLVVGCIATYFIAGPLPPVPGLVWLTLGGWLLVQHGGVRREGDGWDDARLSRHVPDFGR